MNIFPLKKVIEVTPVSSKYCRSGEGCYRFKLECGHETFAKQSAGRPKRKQCRECHYASQK